MRRIRVVTRELDSDSMKALLARHHVGRMAYSVHDHVSILLLNYVYSDEWIYARMEAGPELIAVLHNKWVALETDEAEGLYDWRTVTVHGFVQFLRDGQSAKESGEFAVAVKLIQSVVPSVLTPADPMPGRVQIFRIHVDRIAGTESRSNAPKSLPAP
jgi:nitroimidazol reductase NimA-like FMN-containing flavoprotein (pyridoxamine 5'-phosphate oxidase superfamily)